MTNPDEQRPMYLRSDGVTPVDPQEMAQEWLENARKKALSRIGTGQERSQDRQNFGVLEDEIERRAREEQ
jgi:hypothetical protein